MKSKMIQKTTDELINYVETYERLTGFKIGIGDIKYLQNANVRAFYSADNQLLGGYTISTLEMNSSLRYLDLLSKKGEKLPYNRLFKDLKNAVEITFTFFTHHATRKQRMKMLIYPLYEVWKLGKDIILGGGIVKQFCNRMKPVLSNIYFEGEVEIYGETKQYTVLYEERKNLIINIVKALVPEIQKVFFRI